MGEDIAFTELDALWPDGRRDRIRVGVGQPYYDGALQAWRCPVHMDGLHDGLQAIAGEDSLQALSLALELVHELLAAASQRGARLVHPGASPEGRDHDLEVASYFPRRAPRAP
jgi:hypothetical protein